MSNSTSNPPSGASTPSNSRFISNTETLEDALKTQTVGLVHLSEFKKRRVELAEQREREAAEKLQAAHTSRAGTSSREGSEQPPAKKKKRKAVAKGKLSFGGVEDEDEDGTDPRSAAIAANNKVEGMDDSVDAGGVGLAEALVESEAARKRKVNPKLRAPPPKVLTKNTLLREAQERETLRREFLVLQEKIKNEEISIPFVFYDGMFCSLTPPLYPADKSLINHTGTNVAPPDGGGVQVKKGEAVWLFLERARRMSGRREWLRVSVDDLLLVRGEVIIPHVCHGLYLFRISSPRVDDLY